MEDLQQLPPSSVEAERDVLGACLIDQAALERACTVLHAGDFYSSKHQKIFRAIAALHMAGDGLDQAMVREHLRERGDLEEVGGVLYLAELAGGVASTAHAGQCAQVVKEYARRRRVIGSARDLIRLGHDVGVPVEKLLEEMRTRQEALESDDGAVELPRMSGCYEELLQLAEGPPADILRPAGFEPLLDMLPGRGLWGGLYVIGGPPGVGKTTMTMQLVDAALKADEKLEVLYVSGEMSDAELFMTCACREAELDLFEVLAGRLTDPQKEQFQEALMTVGNRLRRVHFCRDLRVSTMRRLVRRIKPRLVVADYFQLLRPEGTHVMAKDRVDAVARELMEIRNENRGVPILVLASHSRGEGKKPYAPGRGPGAFKETGDIEYSGDRCFNLEYTSEEYQKWRDGETEDVKDLVLVVFKNRLGGNGRVEIEHHGPYQSFTLGKGGAWGQKGEGD